MLFLMLHSRVVLGSMKILHGNAGHDAAQARLELIVTLRRVLRCILCLGATAILETRRKMEQGKWVLWCGQSGEESCVPTLRA